ncbi:MAG: IS1096 element passenger TnpR family protein [Isosphaeraceae bacterium]
MPWCGRDRQGTYPVRRQGRGRPNYGVPGPQQRKKGDGDARTTKLDDLDLNPGRVFGYWFDFGDDWYHQVQVDRIEQAIPTVTYPRVIRRVGKSPPQYCEE